jgi:hypothetical protein
VWCRYGHWHRFCERGRVRRQKAAQNRANNGQPMSAAHYHSPQVTPIVAA